MTVIKQDDLIQSVADALQFISYYHPVDFIQAMHEAYLREESPAARDSMAQILINSRMCATGHRPICRTPANLPGYGDCHRIRPRRHGRALGRCHHGPGRHDQRRRASRLQPAGKRPARLDPGRPGRQPQEHQGQHPGGHSLFHRPGQHRGSGRGGQGRRFREQVEDGHAQSVRLDRRLGPQDRPDHGCRLVPTGHAGHRHRRYCRESGGDGQGSVDGVHRHP